jgi:hypothetical protein
VGVQLLDAATGLRAHHVAFAHHVHEELLPQTQRLQRQLARQAAHAAALLDALDAPGGARAKAAALGERLQRTQQVRFTTICSFRGEPRPMVLIIFLFDRSLSRCTATCARACSCWRICNTRNRALSTPPSTPSTPSSPRNWAVRFSQSDERVGYISQVFAHTRGGSCTGVQGWRGCGSSWTRWRGAPSACWQVRFCRYRFPYWRLGVYC